MSEDPRNQSTGDAFREGVRTVTGVLGALVEALEHTFDELREGGDMSPDRAREAARSTVRKAQETVEDLRDRFDFVPRREFDELRAEVAALRARLDARGDGGDTAGADPEPDVPPSEHGFPIDEG
jgi:polyhydroxyalkanoate synthesis regulator phasin